MLKGEVSALIVGLALINAWPANAHHSFAMFDAQKKVTLDGTVKEYDWSSPHTWLHVLVPDDKGEVQEWVLEGGAPTNLLREGWSKSSMKPGDKILVVIHPLRDGSHGGSLVDVTVNGEHVGNRPPGSPP
jgi:hypothetical protein